MIARHFQRILVGAFAHPILAMVPYVATSLDGFIARKDDGLDWLEFDSTDPSEEDYGFAEFMSTVDESSGQSTPLY